MNVSNREHVFVVLHTISRLDFIAQDAECRQDVLVVFEYVLAYFAEWFSSSDNNRMLGEAWRIATILQCRCFTDDAFILTSTISKLLEAFSLIEKNQTVIESYLDEKAKREARIELKQEIAKLEANSETKVEAVKLEDKKELSDSKAPVLKLEPQASALKLESEASPASFDGSPVPIKKEEGEEDFFGGGGADDSDDDEDSEEEDEDEDKSEPEAKEESKGPCIDLDSDAESVKQEVMSLGSSDGGEDSLEELSESDDVEELGESVFPVPNAGESLAMIRAVFVDRCLHALFSSRGPLWARSKVDNFFQDIFYRKGCLDPSQQMQVEAWQARIKVLQKENEHKIGDANNILEAHRPVVDSRETRTVFDADSNA